MTILLLVALLPPFYMMRMIYLQDKLEKEPFPLIARIFIIGVVIAWPVSVIEQMAILVLGLLLPSYSPLFILLENFLCVALVEEGGKYLAARRVWRNPAFNYRFDGVVYCVAASLGFAAIENVLYVTSYGIGVGIMRALMSIPGHTVFGIYMGIAFGEAKYQECLGQADACKRELKLALLIPTLIHGCYDALLSFDSPILTLVFYIFLIFLYRSTFRKIHNFQAQDRPFFPAW